jgi:hypothetical protein
MPEVATMKETKMDRNISIAFLSKRLNETIRPNDDHIILLFIFYGQPGRIMPQRWEIAALKFGQESFFPFGGPAFFL